MDTLLEESFDEVEIAPEFVEFPNGEYILEIVKAEPKEYEAKGKREAGVRVSVTYKAIETLELSLPNQSPVAVGSLQSESFNLTAQGLPYFKRYITNVFGDAEGVSLGESIRALEGMQIRCLVRTKNSVNPTTGDASSFMNTSRQEQV